MKTRKLLLPVLLTLGIVFFLALPSIADDHKSRVKSVSKRYSKSYSKHRDKTSKGKYDPELDDRAYVDTDQDTKHIINDDDIDSFGYRSNRAIDVSRYYLIKFIQLSFLFLILNITNSYI